MSNQPETMLFSYFPLIMERMRALGLKHIETNPTEELVGEIVHGMEDGSELANARACMWLEGGGGLCAVFVLEQAQRVYDDLLIWADGKPTEWFTVEFHEKGGAYAVALMPILERSIRRHRVAYLMQEGKVFEDAKYRVIMSPIHFVSYPGGHCFDGVKDMIGESIGVYFYEAAKIDPTDSDVRAQLDDDFLLEIGRLGVSSDSTSYMDGLMD